jgi:hypothetical protein
MLTKVEQTIFSLSFLFLIVSTWYIGYSMGEVAGYRDGIVVGLYECHASE